MSSKIRYLPLLLLPFLIINASYAGTPKKSYIWANRLFIKAKYPITHKYEFGYRWDADDAKWAFIHQIKKYGPDTKLYQGLAESQLLLGEYSDAIMSYKNALKLHPISRQLKAELRRAESAKYVSSLASRRFPKDTHILRAVNYSDSYGLVWFILSAVDHKESVNRYSDMRLSVFKMLSGNLKKIWETDQLCYSKQDIYEASSVQLYFEDIAGDGLPEIIVQTEFTGGSWMPSHLAIFRWKDGRMRKLLGVRGDEPLIIKNIDHNGSYEVFNEHAVGYLLCHAAQPRWINIYSYKNGTYRLANKDYPNQYKDLFSEIKSQLKVFPQDWELLKYKGEIYEIRGNSTKALQFYRKALEHLLSINDHEDSREIKNYLTANSMDIKKKIAKIGREAIKHF